MLTGQKIAELRVQAGLTQEQLSQKLYVSRDLVSKWETGRRRPNRRMIRQLSHILHIDDSELLSPDDSILFELSECIPGSFDVNEEKLAQVLNSFLSVLSERDRSVFIRRYYFSDTADEIADNYGLRQNYVRTILMRTRKKLKKYLTEAL